MPVPQTPLKGNGALKGPFHNQLAAQLDAITAALGATPEGTAATVTARLTTSDAATTAKYSKPGTGIPATDMATAVQTSLGKADSALQTKAANQAASGETLYPTVAQFNTLLASLKAAGLMVADS